MSVHSGKQHQHCSAVTVVTRGQEQSKGRCDVCRGMWVGGGGFGVQCL